MPSRDTTTQWERLQDKVAGEICDAWECQRPEPACLRVSCVLDFRSIAVFGRCDAVEVITCIIREAATPSHKSGIRVFSTGLDRAFLTALTIALAVLATSRFVPRWMVIGRSVFGRNVKHGT